MEGWPVRGFLGGLLVGFILTMATASLILTLAPLLI